MKESYVEGLAAHSGPESCSVARQGRAEALTGVRTGRVFSRERNPCHSAGLRGTDAVRRGGRPHPLHRFREVRRSPARSETPSMHGNTSRENREVPRPPAAGGAMVDVARKAAGRIGKSKDTRR